MYILGMAIRKRNIGRALAQKVVTRDQLNRTTGYVYVSNEQMDCSRLYDGQEIKGEDLTVEEKDIFCVPGNFVSKDANLMDDEPYPYPYGNATFDSSTAEASVIFDANLD